MSTVYKEKKISTIGKSILKTLLYYDIFEYPLTAEEVYIRCNIRRLTVEEIKNELECLVKNKYLYQFNKYYLVRNNPEFITKRLRGNELAKKYLTKARRVSRIIAWFPFVRAVFLSGSISKGFMNEKSDIDYFVITHPNRLWISRTLLMLFKKLFLLNSRKYFCINYFIDTAHFEIEEKNLFTATELVTLLPVYGANHYIEFYKSNDWVKSYFPNFPIRELKNVPVTKNGILKSWAEKILNSKTGNFLDALLMRVTLKYWSRKFDHIGPEEFDLAFKSRRYVSKHHPNNFQKMILNTCKDRILKFEQYHKISLR